MIRLAFEEVHGKEWLEEDRAFGSWPKGARTRIFGSERPLDDELLSRPYVASKFGLFTGSAVRVYVEGDTEEFAVREILSHPAFFGVELINLKGVIASGRDNIALKLGDWLKQDKALRRFSVLWFDRDEPANVKTIQRQREQDNIVGSTNFAIDELIEVAARIDEEEAFSGKAVREANWTGVAKAKDFEKRYCAVSDRRPSALKGELWGRALAKYGAERPNRSDNNERRRFLQELDGAVWARGSNYDYQRANFTFNPETFELMKRPLAPIESAVTRERRD